MELATETLHDAMKQWAALQLRVPEVGFELEDGTGEIVAEAELAWPRERVAVLRDDQADERTTFSRADWHVYSIGDGDEVVEAVVEALGG